MYIVSLTRITDASKNCSTMLILEECFKLQKNNATALDIASAKGHLQVYQELKKHGVPSPITPPEVIINGTPIPPFYHYSSSLNRKLWR